MTKGNKGEKVKPLVRLTQAVTQRGGGVTGGNVSRL